MSANGARYDSQRQCISANGARYDSQGQVRSEAEHVAPGARPPIKGRGLKGRNIIPPFQGWTPFFIPLPGATRFALAPGCHISRRWRSSPLAIATRAVGARRQELTLDVKGRLADR